MMNLKEYLIILSIINLVVFTILLLLFGLQDTIFAMFLLNIFLYIWHTTSSIEEKEEKEEVGGYKIL